MQKSKLTSLIPEHLEAARGSSSGRSAQTVVGGHAHTLRQTLIALRAGEALDEHENPGEATVHVLHGQVRLATHDTSCDGATGDLLVVPDARRTPDSDRRRRRAAHRRQAPIVPVARIGMPLHES